MPPKWTFPLPRHRGLEEAESSRRIQRAPEALLLAADDAAHDVLLRDQLRKDRPQALDHRGHELLEEARLEAELGAIEDAAAEDAADDVVAAFVAGQDAVGDGAADRARMIGEHAEGDVGLLLLKEAFALGRDGARVGLAGERGDLVEQTA